MVSKEITDVFRRRGGRGEYYLLHTAWQAQSTPNFAQHITFGVSKLGLGIYFHFQEYLCVRGCMCVSIFTFEESIRAFYRI